MNKRTYYTEKIYNLLNEKIYLGSLTVVDIARELGVTKKTIYNSFKDKDDMLEAVINFRHDKYQKFLSETNDQNLNAIEQLMTVIKFQQENQMPFVSRLHKSLFLNYPEKFNNYYSRFKVSMSNFITKNIVEGKSQGLYRSDIDENNISNFIITTMEAMFDKIINGKDVAFDVKNVHQDIILYHLRGIISKKGAEFLESIHNHTKR